MTLNYVFDAKHVEKHGSHGKLLDAQVMDRSVTTNATQRKLCDCLLCEVGRSWRELKFSLEIISSKRITETGLSHQQLNLNVEVLRLATRSVQSSENLQTTLETILKTWQLPQHPPPAENQNQMWCTLRPPRFFVVMIYWTLSSRWRK